MTSKLAVREAEEPDAISDYLTSEELEEIQGLRADEAAPSVDLAQLYGVPLRIIQLVFGEPRRPSYEVEVLKGDGQRPEPEAAKAIVRWLAEGRQKP
jgi:hypothetical protein